MLRHVQQRKWWLSIRSERSPADCKPKIREIDHMFVNSALKHLNEAMSSAITSRDVKEGVIIPCRSKRTGGAKDMLAIPVQD